MPLKNLLDLVRSTTTARPTTDDEQAPSAMRMRGDYARLEQRVVFSGSPIGDVDMGDVLGDADVDQLDFDGGSDGFFGITDDIDVGFWEPDVFDATESANRKELVFVDTSAADHELLLADLLESREGLDLEVVLIDGDQDGIEQITEALLGFDQLDAIHIVSHGEEGQVHLGDSLLNSQSLSANASQVASWGHALRSDGDILIYGCDLAGNVDGLELIDSISTLTDADVAASDDLTGHADLGGDWEFEYFVGTVEADVAFTSQVQTGWFHTLAGEVAATDEILVNSDPSLPINEVQTTWTGDSSIGIADDGSYVSVFTSTTTDIATGGAVDSDVYFQRFDNLGNTLGDAVRVNQELSNFQDNASVAVNPNGNFVVVWESTGQDNSNVVDDGIYMRMFDADGNPVGNALNPAGDEVLVYEAAFAVGNQSHADIAMNDLGQFVIAWDGEGPPDSQGVYARTFNADGTAASGSFLANEVNNIGFGFNQQNPSVGISGSGVVTIAWEELSTSNVEGRQFDFVGNSVGNEFFGPYSYNVFADQYNTTDPNRVQQFGDIFLDASQPSIDVRDDGYVAIAVKASSNLSFNSGIAVIVMNPDLSNPLDFGAQLVSLLPLNIDFSIADSNQGNQFNPAISFANDDSDALVVTWAGNANL